MLNCSSTLELCHIVCREQGPFLLDACKYGSLPAGIWWNASIRPVKSRFLSSRREREFFSDRQVLLSYTRDIRVYYNSEETHLEILMNLHVFSPSEIDELVSGTSYFCLCPSLLPGQLFCLYLVLTSLFIIGRRPVNMNISARKESPSQGSKTQNGGFL
jgi:hypothetical protein